MCIEKGDISRGRDHNVFPYCVPVFCLCLLVVMACAPGPFGFVIVHANSV